MFDSVPIEMFKIKFGFLDVSVYRRQLWGFPQGLASHRHMETVTTCAIGDNNKNSEKSLHGLGLSRE